MGGALVGEAQVTSLRWAAEARESGHGGESGRGACSLGSRDRGEEESGGGACSVGPGEGRIGGGACSRAAEARGGERNEA